MANFTVEAREPGFSPILRALLLYSAARARANASRNVEKTSIIHPIEDSVGAATVPAIRGKRKQLVGQK